MSMDRGMEAEGKYRLERRARTINGVAGVWINKAMITGIKGEMVESVIVSTVIYGSE